MKNQIENQVALHPEIEHTHTLSWSSLIKMKDSIPRIRERNPVLFKNSVVKRDKENCTLLLNLIGDESFKTFEWAAQATRARFARSI